MPTAKLSISVDETYLPFIDNYQRQHNVKTKSEVLERALELLRRTELERAYAEAAEEWRNNPDAKLWENTVGDGLTRDEW
jgi:hypothetical protein